MDNTEKVNTVTGYVDVLGLLQSRADLRVGYEMNDSDNNFNYYGPRIDSLDAAGQFIPLPNVTNDWRRFTVDFKFYVSKAVGIGVGYWYENFDVTDWNTVDYDPANPAGGGPVGFYPSTGDATYRLSRQPDDGLWQPPLQRWPALHTLALRF